MSDSNESQTKVAIFRHFPTHLRNLFGKNPSLANSWDYHSRSKFSIYFHGFLVMMISGLCPNPSFLWALESYVFFLQCLSCRPFQAVCNQMTIPWEAVFGTFKWQATTTSLKSRGWLDMVPILMAKQGTCTEGMWWPQRRDGKHLKSCESQVLNLLNRMENDGKWLNLWLITICHQDRSSGA